MLDRTPFPGRRSASPAPAAVCRDGESKGVPGAPPVGGCAAVTRRSGDTLAGLRLESPARRVGLLPTGSGAGLAAGAPSALPKPQVQLRQPALSVLPQASRAPHAEQLLAVTGGIGRPAAASSQDRPTFDGEHGEAHIATGHPAPEPHAAAAGSGPSAAGLSMPALNDWGDTLLAQEVPPHGDPARGRVIERTRQQFALVYFGVDATLVQAELQRTLRVPSSDHHLDGALRLRIAKMAALAAYLDEKSRWTLAEELLPAVADSVVGFLRGMLVRQVVGLMSEAEQTRFRLAHGALATLAQVGAASVEVARLPAPHVYACPRLLVNEVHALRATISLAPGAAGYGEAMLRAERLAALLHQLPDLRASTFSRMLKPVWGNNPQGPELLLRQAVLETLIFWASPYERQCYWLLITLPIATPFDPARPHPNWSLRACVARALATKMDDGNTELVWLLDQLTADR